MHHVNSIYIKTQTQKKKQQTRDLFTESSASVMSGFLALAGADVPLGAEFLPFLLGAED